MILHCADCKLQYDDSEMARCAVCGKMFCAGENAFDCIHDHPCEEAL